MIKSAVERGELKPGIKLVEATSGNTGIALAMIARLFGFEIDLIMPDNSTLERVQTMEAYGARVILTPEKKPLNILANWPMKWLLKADITCSISLPIPTIGACTTKPPDLKFGEIPSRRLLIL
jgi:hypothetical protein